MFSSKELQSDFRLRLQHEFSRRCRSNEQYSLRAFARQTGLDPSTLSQILAGKRKISEKMIHRISEEIGLDTSHSVTKDDYAFLQQDAFNVISDWYHFAILDLTLLSNFKNDPIWIAKKLGITKLEVKAALARLIRLGMLEEKNGVVSKSSAQFTNYQEGITSAAHKEYQRQVVKKALHAIDHCRSDHKDITSMTIVTSIEKLVSAKLKIKKFRRQLCQYLEDGKKEAVFHLAVQLYPVTEIEE
jgi:uncharacterized protein (TIGR02147 family)